MSDEHNEFVAYVGHGDTARVEAELAALCEAQGMRRVEGISHPLPALPANEANHWRFLVVPGRPGWHLIFGTSMGVLAEAPSQDSPRRFTDLCTALEVPGRLRELNRDYATEGHVVVDTDGKGQEATRGEMHRHAQSRLWESDDPALWFGKPIAGGLVAIDPWLPTTWTKDESAFEYVQDPEVLLAGTDAQRLGDASGAWWKASNGWPWIDYAAHVGGPLPIEGLRVLEFAWPPGDRRTFAPPPEDTDEPAISRYGDGEEARIGDEVRLGDGERIYVEGVIVRGTRTGWEPGGISTNRAKGSVIIDPAHLPHMRLIRRTPEPSSATLGELLAAAGESHEAQYRVYLAYLHGNGTARNRLKANAWLRRAADGNHPAACHDLAEAYFGGQGLPIDWPAAVSWHKRAVAAGVVRSAIRLAYIQRLTAEAHDRDAQAQHWVATAADMGHETSQLELAQEAYKACDYATSLRWSRLAADQGSPAGADLYADHFYNGHGVAKDLAESFRWYLLAAERGDLGCQCMVGWMLMEGIGMPRDPQGALHWTEIACERGHAQATHNLALWLEDGTPGVPQDLARSYDMHLRIANSNLTSLPFYRASVDAARRMALAANGTPGVTEQHKDVVDTEALYQEGMRRLANPAPGGDGGDAATLLRQAAQLGHGKAGMFLARQLIDKGDPASNTAALSLLRPLANKGMAEAQYELGVLMLRGKGVQHNTSVGKAWLRKAADQGFAPAKRELEKKPGWKFW